MRVFDDAEKWIGDNLGAIVKKKPMGGGSGWASLSRYEVAGMDADIVVKASGSKPLESMFLGEALGLKALGASKTLKIPEVYHMADGFEGGSYFVMDYLEFSGRADPTLFGRKMAEMHLAEPLAAEAKAGRFGFDVDNTCGDTPQLNSWTEGSGTDAWVEFYREQRIGYQIRRARNTQLTKQWERTLEATNGLADLFEGLDVKPSILHGDLWSGNIAAVGGEPAIFDPAVYYGHHEAEWDELVRVARPRLLEGLPRAHPEGRGLRAPLRALRGVPPAQPLQPLRWRLLERRAEPLGAGRGWLELLL